MSLATDRPTASLESAIDFAISQGSSLSPLPGSEGLTGWAGQVPFRRQDDDHHFGSLLMLAVTEGLNLRSIARDSQTGVAAGIIPAKPADLGNQFRPRGSGASRTGS